MILNPSDAVLAITYNCNAKCQMCDIWKIKEKESLLEPVHYTKLPESLRNINISGGEPFLHNEIVKIIDVIHKACPKARMVISSNGYATELILRRFKEIRKVFPAIAIRISIDGLEEVHNKLRGREDFFQRSIETVKKLKEFSGLDLGISYTASNDNIDQLIDVYKLSKNLDVMYTFCGIAHSSEIDNYFVKDNIVFRDLSGLKSGLIYIIEREIKSYSLNKLARTFYLAGVLEHAEKNHRKIFCGALDVLFYLDPFGNVFSCNALGEKLVNIKNKNEKFEEAWCSPKAEEIRQKVNKCPHPCWMLCTVSPFMKKKPFPTIKWIIKNKVRSIFNRELKLN